MKRSFAWAAAVIVLLGIVVLVALRTMDAGPGEPARGGDVTPSPSEAARGLPSAVEPVAAPPETPAPESATAIAGEARPTDDQAAWADVAVATRASQLGVQLARPVHLALLDARERMSGCFADETTRLAHRPPREFDPNDPPRGSAVLDLHLERNGDELLIVAAEPEYLGTSTPELVACCREILVGVQIPVPGTPPASRYRLKFPLQ